MEETSNDELFVNLLINKAKLQQNVQQNATSTSEQKSLTLCIEENSNLENQILTIIHDIKKLQVDVESLLKLYTLQRKKDKKE